MGKGSPDPAAVGPSGPAFQLCLEVLLEKLVRELGKVAVEGRLLPTTSAALWHLPKPLSGLGALPAGLGAANWFWVSLTPKQTVPEPPFPLCFVAEFSSG